MKQKYRLLIPFIALLPIIALLNIFTFSPAISIAQGEITVIDSSAESQFPSAITFNLEAEAATEIADIDLSYRLNRQSTVAISSRVDVDFIADQHVTASWTWDMLETGGLPPGTEIDYWWLIEDVAGHKFETTLSTIVYDDPRHAWQSIDSNQVTIYWYDGDLSFAQKLVDATSEALERLWDEIGITLEQHAKIYIYASSLDLQGALVYPQEWTGGITFPSYSTIIIGISPGNLAWGERAIAHELGHLVIHQEFSGLFGRFPVWLDEGLAMDAEGDLRSDLQNQLSEAIVRDTLFSVHSISSSFPTDTNDARLCYAESYSLVQYLLDTYGSDSILVLLDVFKEGSTNDDALIDVYRFNMDGLNAEWRESLGLGAQPSPISSSGDSGLAAPYIVLLVILFILGILSVVLALTVRSRL